MDDKQFLIEVGSKIKQQRKLIDVKQDELGYHPTQFGRYERGEIAMSIISLRDICMKLQVSADYLLGLPNNMNGLTADQEAVVLLIKKLNTKNIDRLTGAVLQLLSMQQVEQA